MVAARLRIFRYQTMSYFAACGPAIPMPEIVVEGYGQRRDSNWGPQEPAVTKLSLEGNAGFD